MADNSSTDQEDPSQVSVKAEISPNSMGLEAQKQELEVEIIAGSATSAAPETSSNQDNSNIEEKTSENGENRDRVTFAPISQEISTDINSDASAGQDQTASKPLLIENSHSVVDDKELFNSELEDKLGDIHGLVLSYNLSCCQKI